METKFVNLTGKMITLWDIHDTVLNTTAHVRERVSEDIVPLMYIPPAEITTTSGAKIVDTFDEINGVPVLDCETCSIFDLPEPEENTIFIVNVAVLHSAHYLGRSDLVAMAQPVGCVVLNQIAAIIGFAAFAKFKEYPNVEPVYNECDCC